MGETITYLADWQGTTLGRIPKDWEVRRLEQMAEILDQLRVPINSEERSGRPGVVPYYGANGQQGWIDDFLFDEALILIAEDGGNFDDFAGHGIAYKISGKSWVNNHAHVLRASNGNSLDFLYFTLAHRDIRRYIAGSTRSKLTQRELRSIEIAAPFNAAEQFRIAAVLDTVEKTIAKTEAVIAKLKQIRAGVLHDLLTRGLDENGQLRDPVAHSEQFQDSPVGRIPKEWEIATLVSRITLPEGQVDPRVPPYADWILVAPDHIESATGRLLATQTATEQNAISGKYLFEAGDVVYSKIRPYLRKAILANFQGLCSADMYPLRPNTGIRSRFLLAVVLGEAFSRFASAVSMRSGFPKINREELAQFVTAWPKTCEQERIAEVLMASDSEQLAVERDLAKLNQVKSGLMNDLLTGRVRVPEGIAVT